MYQEAHIIINGRPLSEAESMTVRVALEGLASVMIEENALGDDTYGEAIRKGYLKNIVSIREVLYTDACDSGK